MRSQPGEGPSSDCEIFANLCLVYPMLSQVHDIYQTNPAFKKRICLGIICSNTVNQ